MIGRGHLRESRGGAWNSRRGHFTAKPVPKVIYVDDVIRTRMGSDPAETRERVFTFGVTRALSTSGHTAPSEDEPFRVPNTLNWVMPLGYRR